MTPTFSISPVRSLFALSAGLVIPLLAGCRKQSEITVYRLQKAAPDDSANVQSAPPAPPEAPATPAASSVQWTAPAGWQEQPATGFLKGSFTVEGAGGKKADVSVVAVPPMTGGLPAAVNRLRNRLQLPPIPESALNDAGSMISVDGQNVYFIDLVSDKPLEGGVKSRTLNGILSLPDETWFFKMAGPDQLVEAQRDAFQQFLQSLKISAADNGQPPPVADTSSPGSPPMSTPPAGPLNYQLPSGWKEKPLTPMRVASFSVPGGAAGDADASIVVLSGMAGGELDNVNRWRDQIGLGPVGPDALDSLTKHVEANGHDFLVADLVNPHPTPTQRSTAHILVATLTENNLSWFIKMTGPDQVVAAQHDAFVDLLKSLTLPQ